jgi:hypothetical protein
MAKIPLVPVALDSATLIVPSAPVLPLARVRLPEFPLCANTTAPLVKFDPASVMVTAPAPEVAMRRIPEPEETSAPTKTPSVLPPFTRRSPVVVKVEPAPDTLMLELVLFENTPVIVASPPACTVSVRAAPSTNTPSASRVSRPPLSVKSPFELQVPPMIAIVPVAFTVVRPVPLWKAPLLCTLSVPVLALAAPISGVPAPPRRQ